MEQLVLDIAPVPRQGFDNFISGRNRELLRVLQELVASAREQIVYVWGAPGSGKTHLLQSAIRYAHELGLSASYGSASRETLIEIATAPKDLLAIDDVASLDGEAQITLFSIYEYVREHEGRLIASGALPPARLEIRADLATRLASGLVYEVHALSDEEKATALREHAKGRGFALSGEVVNYLLHRERRDLAWLLATLDTLDRYSLQTKRAITVPLLKDLLAAESSPP
jgi:DnaA-homolog protein